MPITIAATRESSPLAIETELAALSARVSAEPRMQRDIEVRLPATSTQILADVWLAILTGTVAANWPTTVVARGMSELDVESHFMTSLAALSIIRTAHQIVPEASRENVLDASKAIMQLIAMDGGLVRTRGGGQVLLEVDPDFPVAARLTPSEGIVSAPSERRRMFTQLVLHLRKMVEIGALRRQIDPVSEGPGGAVGRFLSELHENALEHGSRDNQGRKIPGSRLLRLRKHIANQPEELVSRHGGVAELRGYLESIHTSALVEASISDFGPGIVDGFLDSPIGARHAGRNRRELLESLLFERLSSKGIDPASGLGIQQALRAANQMQAFVSVRTAEFWLAASFANPTGDIRMIDVGPDTRRGKVRGTHWQLLWPQP